MQTETSPPLQAQNKTVRPFCVVCLFLNICSSTEHKRLHRSIGETLNCGVTFQFSLTPRPCEKQSIETALLSNLSVLLM